MSNVTPFPGLFCGDIPPDVVLGKAADMAFQRVIVIGASESGDVHFMASASDLTATIVELERVRLMLIMVFAATFASVSRFSNGLNTGEKSRISQAGLSGWTMAESASIRSPLIRSASPALRRWAAAHRLPWRHLYWAKTPLRPFRLGRRLIRILAGSSRQSILTTWKVDMPIRDILRPAGLMALAALLFIASKSPMVTRFDEFLSPVLTAFSVGFLGQALVYIMGKIQFGGSMTALEATAKCDPLGAALIYAGRTAYMIALLVLFTGMLS